MSCPRAREKAIALRCAAAGVALAAMAAASGCTSTPPRPTAAAKPTKEYFAESEYGVKASPRVSNLRSRLPRGGGRDQVGKPYKVKDKWYYPKEDNDYRKAGLASWYGDAFHGRLTANGEIYDMTHLTAAHPTMPLPSYARVTNRENGSSVIVRVNDRGPYAHGRIIDLSRRAAELLDYTHNGVARVDVEYLGRAPLHGQDDDYLMASYRPGNRAPDPSDGLPAGVMIAMNGATPTTAPAGAAPFPGTRQATGTGLQASDPRLPDLGPIAPERPWIDVAGLTGTRVAAAAYADARVAAAARAVESFASAGAGDGAVVAALNARHDAEARGPAGSYVAVGTFFSRAEADAIAQALSSRGTVAVDADAGSFDVTLRSDGRAPIDDLLRAAWAAGATDAMTIRD